MAMITAVLSVMMAALCVKASAVRVSGRCETQKEPYEQQCEFHRVVCNLSLVWHSAQLAVEVFLTNRFPLDFSGQFWKKSKLGLIEVLNDLISYELVSSFYNFDPGSPVADNLRVG